VPVAETLLAAMLQDILSGISALNTVISSRKPGQIITVYAANTFNTLYERLLNRNIFLACFENENEFPKILRKA